MDRSKAISAIVCILWSLFAFGIATEENDHFSLDHSIEELSTHLLELENRDFCTSKDIVLIAGYVQSGKTALISHLTDSSLLPGGTSVHVDARSNLPDDTETNQINDSASNCNGTDAIIPRLTSDKLNGIDYYNCPSVGAQQTIEHEIIAMESVKKLLDCSRRRMKLVFTINLPPNRMFEVSRADFLSLAEQATRLLKNITEFRNSIMLVVTEFQDFYTNTEGQYQFIDDQNMTVRVATFLHRIKHSLDTPNRWYTDQVKAKIVEFIDILLQQQENEYVKIGISRLQLHDLAARNVELLDAEKQRIISILNYRLAYIDVSPTDFNTAISTEMENLVRRRISDVQNHLSQDVNNIDLAIKEFYASKEAHMTDVYTFDNEISIASLKLSTQIRPDQSKPFIGQIASIMNVLNISVCDGYIAQFSKHINYIDLLKNLTAPESRSRQRLFIPISPLKSTIKYLNDIKKWYSFVIKLSTAMDRYTAQQDITMRDVGDLLGHCTLFGENIGNASINVNTIGLAEFAAKIGSSSIFQMVANMTVNGHMLNALKMAVGWAYKPVELKCTERTLTAFGYNVKISDLTSEDCMRTASVIEIFAWNKLFIDDDINKTGQRAQVTFIAPIWEIIGERRVILSGENAQAYAEAASRTNDNGEPGLPGGSSGHFLGIGNTFTNAQQLEVVGVGGRGGDGQNARDPKNLTIADQHQMIANDLKQITKWFESQSNASVSPSKFSLGSCTAYPHYSTDDMVSLQVICENEVRSENMGGLGGSGGLGGNFGEIVLIGFEQEPKICIVKNAGENGESGKAFTDGIDNGFNSVGLKVPDVVAFHPLQLLNDFTDNMRIGSERLFRKASFLEFLTQLSGSRTIQLLIDKQQDTLDTDSDKTENSNDDDIYVIN